MLANDIVVRNLKRKYGFTRLVLQIFHNTVVNRASKLISPRRDWPDDRLMMQNREDLLLLDSCKIE